MAHDLDLSRPWDTRPFRSTVQVLFLFLAFFFIALAMYYPGLRADTYYDTKAHILGEEAVYASHRLFDVLGTFPQRPVTIATFFVNYLCHGMDAYCFRLYNIAILAATGVAVALLMFTIMEILFPKEDESRAAVSVVVALFFVIHPILTWATLYIWQRAALLACFFSVSTLTMYLAVRTGRFPFKIVGYLICFVLFEAALFSKENSIALPVVLTLAEFSLLSGRSQEALKRGAVFCLIAVLSVVFLSFLEHPDGNVKLGEGIFATVSQYYQSSGLALKQVVLTQCRMYFFYLSLIVAPLPSRVQLLIPQTISSSLSYPPSTLLAVVGVGAMVSTGMYLLKKRPAWGFGILFYSVSLLPEALFVPQYPFFGYRAIMPMVGILVTISDLLVRVFKWFNDQGAGRRMLRILFVALGGVYLALIGVDSFNQAELWRDTTAFWRDVVARFPTNEIGVERSTRVHALYNLGYSLLEKQRLPEAFELFSEACRIAPDHAESQNAAGVVLRRLGRLAEAEKHFRIATELDPRNPKPRKNLDRVIQEQAKLKQNNARENR